MRGTLLVCLVLFTTPAFAEKTQMRKVISPIEVVQEAQDSKGIEGLQWNRWASDNFVVLSLNNLQAEYLYEHLELVKTWVFERWHLADMTFGRKCKFICVDDAELFQKLFRLNQTTVEVRRNPDGTIKETIVFLLIDGTPSQTVPVPLSEVCMAEFCDKYESKLSWCTIRGMSLLNGSFGQIRGHLAQMKSHIDRDDEVYLSESLLKMTEEEYRNESPEDRLLFDHSALLMCLMIHKELGGQKFHDFMKMSLQPQVMLHKVFEAKSFEEVDARFKKYILEKAADTKIKDKYLQIN